jgi:NADPH:quinone reductase
MACRRPAHHNIAGQFALSETARAHLAMENGDKLGTVIVDCARCSTAPA